MQYFFERGKAENKKTLLLLHGTGGTEKDLVPVANILDEEAHILGVRGNVLENGMPRFFRRLAEGIFDEADLITRTKELNDFIGDCAMKDNFSREEVIAVGYSNGANIAASLLFHHEHALKGAVLFHPMVPRKGITLPDLTGIPIFIGAGKNDPICTLEETEELTSLLKAAGADVTIHLESNGHQLTLTEVKAAQKWYDEHFS